MASTLQEQLAAKKAAATQNAKEGDKAPAETGAATTTTPVVQTEAEKVQNLASTQQVAKDANTQQIPTAPTGPGAPIATGIQHSIVQSGAETDAQKQTERTEVDTHLTIVEQPRGSDRSTPNPPMGTLPNSNLVYEGDKNSPMHKHTEMQQAGLAQNKLSPEEEEKQRLLIEGEERRQRMLSGFPRAEDLAAEQEEAEKPEGGWKAIGIQRVIRKDGSILHAIKGYFVPRDEEDTKELKYFESKGLVEKP